MNDIIKNIEAAQLKESVPSKTWILSRFPSLILADTLTVSPTLKLGTVIKRQNGGVRETFTVRKNSNGIGVEKTWPLHSPSVDNVEVVRKGKVRRAKLNYLRDRVGKAAKVKELVK